jgi:hypothetical protein
MPRQRSPRRLAIPVLVAAVVGAVLAAAVAFAVIPDTELPAGTYSITAKTNLFSGFSGMTAECFLEAGLPIRHTATDGFRP